MGLFFCFLYFFKWQKAKSLYKLSPIITCHPELVEGSNAASFKCC
jgi:hypothetical protein